METRDHQQLDRNIKYLLEDADNHKAIVHQLDFIGSFLQAKVKNRVFEVGQWKSLDII